MPPLINVRSISKAFGSDPLFQNVSFTVSEGDRVGLIGPNGSGKSTLLRILAGTEDTDDGEIAVRKRIRLSYVEQESEFRPGDTVRSLVEAALKASAVTESERGTRFAETLGRAGFVDLEAEATALSASQSSKRWSRAPIFCYSMSPRTIWTWLALSGSKRSLSKLASPVWSSATIAIFWRMLPPRWRS